MQFIIGIKILGLVSVIFGGALLTICGVSLHEFRNAKFTLQTSPVSPVVPTQSQISSTPSDSRHGQHSRLSRHPSQVPFLLTGDTDAKVDIIADSIAELKIHWNEFKPFLLGSSGVALVCGIVQVLTSVYLLLAGSKVIRSRSKSWKCTHVILFCVLMASLFVPVIFNVRHDSIGNLRELLVKIGASLKSKEKLDNFRVSLVELLGGMIALDIAAIVVLITSTCCLMTHDEYDYREP